MLPRPRARRPRGGQGQAERAHRGDPAPDRSFAARRPWWCSVSARSSSTATSCRPMVAPHREPSVAFLALHDALPRLVRGGTLKRPPVALVLRRDQRRHRRRLPVSTSVPRGQHGRGRHERRDDPPVGGASRGSSRSRARPRARRSRGTRLARPRGARAGRDHRPAGRDHREPAPARAVTARRRSRPRSSSVPRRTRPRSRDRDRRRRRRPAAAARRGSRRSRTPARSRQRPPEGVAAIVAASGLPGLADDTGLEVAALTATARCRHSDATPSAARLTRRTGPSCSPTSKRGSTGRPRFRTIAMVVWPDGSEVFAEGTCDGEIVGTSPERGGFGYDSVFVPAEGDVRTFAEMTHDEKHRSATGAGRSPRCSTLTRAARSRPRGDDADGNRPRLVIGTGSGNSIPGPEFDDLDIAIVEHGKFGGTSSTSVPTKMYIYRADLAAGPAPVPISE